LSKRDSVLSGGRAGRRGRKGRRGRCGGWGGVAGLFPNEASLLRLVSAVLSETSEEWETGRIYLSMEGMPV